MVCLCRISFPGSSTSFIAVTATYLLYCIVLYCTYCISKHCYINRRSIAHASEPSAATNVILRVCQGNSQEFKRQVSLPHPVQDWLGITVAYWEYS